MFCHLTTKMKGKGKHKQGVFLLAVTVGHVTSLFVVIVSFPFIFLYTQSYQFIVMFYLTCLIFLLIGHISLLVAIGVASWGAAWRGGGGSRGGRGSHGACGSCGAGGRQ
jgi:hypothetical protein